MTYTELHCHSAYSFLDGASLPDELAAAAAAYGYEALALTDHDGLHGAMEFAHAARAQGVRPITGAELTLAGGRHLTLLCEDRAGYRNLCRLITRAHEGTRDGREALPPSVTPADVEAHAEGLVCLSGCARHGVHSATGMERLLRIFGPDRFRVELQRPFERFDRRRNRMLAGLAERLGVPTVATGDVHVHARERAPLQDALVAVRLGKTLDECEPERRGNSLHALAPPEAMAERFADHPGAVEEAGRLAERLRFDLTEDLGYRYPGADDPDADRKLAEICRARLEDRYPPGHRRRHDAESRLDEELRVIRHLGLAGFFLLHREMLELAREVACEVRGPDTVRALLPPGRGRGSSVASIVCYLTGLSHVDPVEKDLHLGRFLNDELTALPDIDLDFPRDIRERLIPRVHELYGPERSALVGGAATYRARGAVRDFAKALGLPPGEIERLARVVDPWKGEGIEEDVKRVGARQEGSPRWGALAWLIREGMGLPRHPMQHPGGMVVSTEPLVDLCPVMPCAMEGRQMVQWDKDSCADAGFLKIDLLGLGMLSAVERCVEAITKARGERIDLSRIPYDDPEVYEMIQAAETTGVFQIESRAQMSMLPRTRPENLDDLTVQVALVRPGPIQGGAVHPYIERKKRLREDPDYEVPYEHPSLEPVLRDTLGAIVFQDQVIEVAMAFAGFSAGEAEGLRRAMSRKRSEAAMRSYEQKFIEGAVARGVERVVAERVFSQIVGFSGFGFPKSHSAAFGLLAYQSTWLRVHYGAEFLCSLLNEQPMGFYPPDALVHESQRRGIEVLPPCVQRSTAECTAELLDDRSQTPAPLDDAPDRRWIGTHGLADSAPTIGFGRMRRPARSGASPRARGSGIDHLAIRMGLGYVNGVRAAEVARLVEERERNGGWSGVEDLASRSGASADTLSRLAWAGACDELVAGGRRVALWLLGVAAPAVEIPVGTQLSLPLESGEAPGLRELGVWERMLADYGSTGVTLREHPLELMRPALGERFASSVDLQRTRDGGPVTVAGLVVARQRPATAKGVTFMLLEDEHGTINLVIPPPVFDRHRAAVRGEPLLAADGRLERREGVTNVVVERVWRLERPDLPQAEVRHIEPRRAWSTQEEADDLRAVAPAGHSFGRRGR